MINIPPAVERVWHFYTNVKHLEIITPKEMNLKIIKIAFNKIIKIDEIEFIDLT